MDTYFDEKSRSNRQGRDGLRAQQGIRLDTKPDNAGKTEDTLLYLVYFKWLMAASGFRIDLSRMRCDMDFAAQCLQQGIGSESDVLRKRSAALLPLLARSLAHQRPSSALVENDMHA